jgi:hypothetical protein
MNLIKGWHLPDWDTHYEHTLKEHKGKWEYQKDTRDFSLEHCNNFEAEAIDVGGNVGFWSETYQKDLNSFMHLNHIQIINWHLQPIWLTQITHYILSQFQTRNKVM